MRACSSWQLLTTAVNLAIGSPEPVKPKMNQNRVPDSIPHPGQQLAPHRVLVFLQLEEALEQSILAGLEKEEGV